jgi:hypothetical protein
MDAYMLAETLTRWKILLSLLDLKHSLIRPNKFPVRRYGNLR